MIKHDTKNNDNQQNAVKVILCWVPLMLSVNYAEYCKQAHYTEYHYAECHYADCHGTDNACFAQIQLG